MTLSFNLAHELAGRRPLLIADMCAQCNIVAAGRGWVDLHPVVFDGRGHGRQADVDGGCFDYPPEAFTEGVLERIVVPCLSREQQMRFHRGYVPRAVDLHDLRLLEELASTPDGGRHRSSTATSSAYGTSSSA